MKKIFLIDNYDSFTYNLSHYLEELGCDVTVKRNDMFEIEEISNYDGILISPGPGIPDEAGLTKKVIKEYFKKKNILGVCLGQQAIAEVFGGEIENMKEVYHGVASKINFKEDDDIFNDLPKSIDVGRYHSWIVKKPLPEGLIITSVDEENQVMSLKHSKYSVRGVQFHPESILTPHGKQIIKNWIKTI
ncbi:MAG: aminodeoxychorismate/anthranilate synthase component II [Flavobacteriales bacterium]|nr:MAG: aminodeoxychorismate/anthranilate synthase component II [Flavobacteriales bacterium]|tara:strand:- start:17015 stop:17581 length:567 start_codon:yes stop_codon:yes gene_type:complete